MCGGGTTQTSTVSIPPEVLANYQKVFGRAEQIAEKPFQAYSQDPNAFVAGLNPTQQASLENINAIQGMASGDVAAGQGLIGAGTQRGGELQYQSLGSGQRGVDAGEQLYGQSLGSAQQGQQVGGQLFGSSLGTADRATGLATNLYGQSLGAAQQGQQIGGQLFGGSLGTAGAGQSEASNISRQALSDTDFARGTGQAYAGDAAQNIYSGIAAADPYMREASNLSRAGLGAGQQYANQALNYLGAGTQDVGVGDLDTERYMSPYLNQVVRAQQALQAEENEAQRSALKGQAIRAGAFGGDRAGVAQANLARQQSLANQATLSNILQQGYGQAQGVAGQQQQSVLHKKKY